MNQTNNLHRLINKPEDLNTYDLLGLRNLHDEHEAEIVRLTGQIAASTNTDWKRRAQQVRRYLLLHRDWIARAIHERHKANTAQTIADAKARKAEQKLANIAASNDTAQRHIAIFKEVAKEFLGDKLYEDLWAETRKRISEQGL